MPPVLLVVHLDLSLGVADAVDVAVVVVLRRRP
jgi:hypothetical protein